ncbi:MAG: type I 3-dehydroquinate dehydratase [Planctomycetota bacterium]|nr:MAG: type I 3-dehydroquinate dehydratase [Planctomycetota bacterium]
MICITVNPSSRKLAKVDLLNAARQCDMVELCLDRFIKSPDIPDLLKVIDKPILISCRRPQEGGHWDRGEEDRLKLLRTAIVAGPAYVELDLETAAQIPRYGQTKRVISYTNLEQPVSRITPILERAAKVQADVVKFTWPVPTMETAWPLLGAVVKPRSLPVVGLGLGDAGITFSLLGRKYGSPWLYAALEKGMEAYPSQPTVSELDDVFHWRQIDSDTRFLGIMGYEPSMAPVVRALNRMFVESGHNLRCLPLADAQPENMKKILELLNIRVVVASPRAGRSILAIASEHEESARLGRHADLLVLRDNGWSAYNGLWRAVIMAMETLLMKHSASAAASQKPLDRRNVLVIGSEGLGESVIYGLKRRNALISICNPDDKVAQQIAQKFQIRAVPHQNLYNTLADVVIFADFKLKLGEHTGRINPSFLRPTMYVADAAAQGLDSPIIQEARERGCRVAEPLDVLAQQTALVFKTLTGRDAPPERLREALAGT